MTTKRAFCEQIDALIKLKAEIFFLKLWGMFLGDKEKRLKDNPSEVRSCQTECQRCSIDFKPALALSLLPPLKHTHLHSLAHTQSHKQTHTYNRHRWSLSLSGASRGFKKQLNAISFFLSTDTKSLHGLCTKSTWFEKPSAIKKKNNCFVCCLKKIKNRINRMLNSEFQV